MLSIQTNEKFDVAAQCLIHAQLAISANQEVFGANRTYITDNSITHCKQNIASIR